MELTLLVLGWLVPWALGMGLVAALPRKTDSVTDAGALAWTMGSGFELREKKTIPHRLRR